MDRMERRAIGRVFFPSKGVIVVCDSQQVIYVTVRDLSPIGVGVVAPADTANLVGKDVIFVGETLIMYADVVRQNPTDDGNWIVGLSARKFTPDVLQYLFDSIEHNTKQKEESHQ